MCLQTIKNPPPRLLNTAHVPAKLDTVRPTLIVPIIARFLRRRSLVIFRNGLCYVQLPLPNVFGRSSQATAQGLTDFACIMATPNYVLTVHLCSLGTKTSIFSTGFLFYLVDLPLWKCKKNRRTTNPHIHGVPPATQMASDHVLGVKEPANTKDGAPH